MVVLGVVLEVVVYPSSHRCRRHRRYSNSFLCLLQHYRVLPAIATAAAAAAAAAVDHHH